MKIRYLMVAALAIGLFSVQPVFAQSEAHETDPHAVHTHTHKHKTYTHHKKTKKPAAPVTPTDKTKTQ